MATTPTVAPQFTPRSSRFHKATRRKLKLRMALCGIAKAGKSLTATRFAFALAAFEAEQAGRPPRVFAIDTENRSLSKYQGDSFDGNVFDFEVCEMTDFGPGEYMAAMADAANCGCDVLIIDSLSHAWSGPGGVLDIADRATAKSKSKNSFTEGWREASPLHNDLVDTIVRFPAHIICTMREKMQYEVSGGQPIKIGMGPVQRNGIEYEFDIVCDIDENHILRVSGSRCSAIDRKQKQKPGAEFMAPVIHWLNYGNDIPNDLLTAAQLSDVAARAERHASDHNASGNGQPAAPPKSFRELAAERNAAAKQGDPASPHGQNVAAALSPTKSPEEKPAEATAGKSATESAPATDKASQEGNGQSATEAAKQGSASLSTGGTASEAAPPAIPSTADKPIAKKPAAKKKPSGSPKLDAAVAAVERQAAEPREHIGLSVGTINAIEAFGERVYGDKWADVRSRTCAARGVGKLTGLPQAAADEILGKLVRGDLKAGKPAEQPESFTDDEVSQIVMASRTATVDWLLSTADAIKARPAVDPREAVNTIRLDALCTASHIDDIRQLVGKLTKYCPDQEQRVIAVVKQIGQRRNPPVALEGKAKELTVGEAAKVIQGLRKKLQDCEATERFGPGDSTTSKPVEAAGPN